MIGTVKRLLYRRVRVLCYTVFMKPSVVHSDENYAGFREPKSRKFRKVTGEIMLLHKKRPRINRCVIRYGNFYPADSFVIITIKCNNDKYGHRYYIILQVTVASWSINWRWSLVGKHKQMACMVVYDIT